MTQELSAEDAVRDAVEQAEQACPAAVETTCGRKRSATWMSWPLGAWRRL